ncbi:hypothetical protein B0H17DRAFT_1135977 [Mycena rosella]|uniref:Uncharacterized protein n=1 Tax=Mycena rosella TaxID=1033263 RepID=A0AAD7DBS6_MYCRO|nr:hypothetical protein B0H17DRAFT_1135977 [Mycena rosella]
MHLPQPVEDPVIVPVHSCEHCHIDVMEALRVHEGSTNLASCGRVVQTCTGCHKSHYHTSAYIYSDALHLVARVNARQLGTMIPRAAEYAPLRFAPAALSKPPPGVIYCGYPGCSTNSGSPRQASRKPGSNPPPVQPALPVHPPPHAERGRGHGAPALRETPAAVIRPRARPLAQPMSQTWMDKRQAVLTQKGPIRRPSVSGWRRLLNFRVCSSYFTWQVFQKLHIHTADNQLSLAVRVSIVMGRTPELSSGYIQPLTRLVKCPDVSVATMQPRVVGNFREINDLKLIVYLS